MFNDYKYRKTAERLDPMFNLSDVGIKNYTEDNAKKIINLCIVYHGNHINTEEFDIGNFEVKTKDGTITTYYLSDFRRLIGFDLLPSAFQISDNPYDWINFLISIEYQLKGITPDDVYLQNDFIKGIVNEINHNQELSDEMHEFYNYMESIDLISTTCYPNVKPEDVFKISSDVKPIDYLDFDNPYMKLLTRDMVFVKDYDKVFKMFNFLYDKFLKLK